MRFRNIGIVLVVLASLFLFCRHARAEEKIVWGKTFHGLQGGISFAGGSGPFKAGDKVALNMYWRNVTRAPVQISYVTYVGSGFRPSVWTSKGTRVPMDAEVVTAFVQTTKLEAGQTLRIAQPVFEIDKADTRSDALLPKYHIGAGRYRVNVSGGEMDSMAPPSGMLDFSVVE